MKKKIMRSGSVEEAENEKNRELGVVMCVKNEDNLPHH